VATIPRSLLIGGFRYAVEHGDGLIETEGEHWRTRGRLVLDFGAKTSPDRRREVLVHEILHAIRTNGGHDEKTQPSTDEYKAHMREVENFICSLQWGIVNVLRSNPELVAYLTGED